MLTDRQKAVLDFILGFIEKQGYPPSVREIGKAVGLSSSSSVHAHIGTLTKLGYLDRDRSKSRALRPGREAPVTARSLSGPGIPVLGTVPAGDPLTATELWEGTLSLPEGFLPPGELFALRVRGESMIGIGIKPGDLVIVRRQPRADEGTIVVALLEDEATLKRFFRTGPNVRLEAENPAMPPIIAKDVAILGVVTGHIRRF